MKDFFKDMQAKKDCEKAAERTWKTSMKELLVYIESIIPDEEVKKSWFTLPIIMQSKNTHDFSNEMN